MKTGVQVDTYTPIHSITTHSSYNMGTTESPSVDEWISKKWYIHKMEYYSAIKWNGVLTHTIT